MAQRRIDNFEPWVEKYTHFANDNINVLSVSATTETTAIVLEYAWERSRDGKLIWPKIAIEAPTLGEAIGLADNIISGIRRQ